MPLVAMTIGMMIVMARAKTDADLNGRGRVVARHGADRRSIDHHGRRLHTDGSRGNYVARRRVHGYGVNRIRIDRCRMDDVADGVNRSDAGENFADRGPLTVAGGCGLNTGKGEGGET